MVYVEQIRRERMILVNTDYISGKELETLGLVSGSMVKTRNLIRDLTQSIKALFGVELPAYTEMMNYAREVATKRMVEEAEKLGADAVINIRYATTDVMPAASDFMAYGTAVRFK